MFECARHLRSIRRFEAGFPALLGPSTRFRGNFRSRSRRRFRPAETGGKIFAISESAFLNGFLGAPLSLGFFLALFLDALAHLQAEEATFSERTDRLTMRAKPS